MGTLLAATGGFALGIFAETVWGLGWPAAGFTLLIAALVLGAYFTEARRVYALGALALVCVALGVGRAALVDTTPPTAFAADLRHRVSYEGVVIADPDLKDATARIAVRASRGGASAGVLAVVPRTELARVGDRVRVTGTLTLPAPFAGDGGRIFAYDKYLAVRGISYLLDYGSLRVESHAPWYSVSAALARAKHWFLAGLSRAMPEPYASLAGGVVVGGKSGLGAELQGAFTRTGLLQIIVLSGYNVMVVAEWVMALVAFLGLRRATSAAFGATALLLFIGVAGFSATALRAGLMALIALYARATGRSYAASRALLVVVALMLAWQPLLLAFDPGFDLSVAATAGLIWLAPLIERRLAALRLGAFWGEATATTLAAQIAVLPLLLYETGNLSFVAIPANLLVAPVVPLAMAAAAFAGLVGASVGALIPALATLAGLPGYLATAYLVFVAQSFGALSWAAETLPAFPFWFVPLAYAALAAAAFAKRSSTTVQFTFAKKASRYFDFSAGR